MPTPCSLSQLTMVLTHIQQTWAGTGAEAGVVRTLTISMPGTRIPSPEPQASELSDEWQSRSLTPSHTIQLDSPWTPSVPVLQDSRIPIPGQYYYAKLDWKIYWLLPLNGFFPKGPLGRPDY